LRCAALHALAHAQCRFFPEIPGEGNKTRALIDLGAEYVKIAIFRGREIFLVREFPLPDDHAEVSPYHLTAQQPQDQKTANGNFPDLAYLLSTGPGDENGTPVDSQQDPQVLLSLDALGDEIKLTLKYFLANMENSIDEAWVIGGGACAQPAVDYLANVLELPIQRVSLHDGVPIHAGETTRRELQELWPVLFSALSLAYVESIGEPSGRFAAGGGVSIALPKWAGRFIPQPQFFKGPRPAIAATVLLAIVALPIFVSHRVTLARLNAELEGLSAERAALEDSVFIMRLQLPATNGAETAGSFESPRPAYWTGLLHELGHHLPGSLRLSQVSSQRIEENLESEPGSESTYADGGAASPAAPRNRAGDQITLKGTTQLYEAIDQLLYRIRQIPEFKFLSVHSIKSTFDPAIGAFDFTIIVRVYWN
jgi:hypothetical protein